MPRLPRPAVLAFSDGAEFSGQSAGFEGESGFAAAGEVIFNTAMTGYQEVLTDPSYYRQIINFTHPHIGNTGITKIDNESPRIFAAGMIARRITDTPSNWRSTMPLPDFLQEQKIPAIAGVDTRAITRKLRQKGALAGCILIDGDAAEAVRRAKEFSGLRGAGLAADADRKARILATEADWQPNSDDYALAASKGAHVVVLDCGVKESILRCLTARGCRVTLLPYDSDLTAVLAEKPDGVLISNGPGDPQPCDKAEALAKSLLSQKIPLFGLCLGHQIVAAALGAKTYKMKFGHHGANHPVAEVLPDGKNGRVLITSQNHGFAVDEKSLPNSVSVTHRSLFDSSLQGIGGDNPPVLTFQGHPESSPGPHDAGVLFDRFVNLMNGKKGDANAS